MNVFRPGRLSNVPIWLERSRTVALFVTLKTSAVADSATGPMLNVFSSLRSSW